MHRSGTSLITSAFQLAGVNIGDRLIGRQDSNRRGHFEDVEFEEFHERVLRRVGKHHLTVVQADVLEMTPEEVEHAKALIARRRERRLWGWKDPRTCLFLDFWHSLLTNPRYVFVYRHPLDVVRPTPREPAIPVSPSWDFRPAPRSSRATRRGRAWTSPPRRE